MPQLDGKYTMFGQVTAGTDVPAKLQVGDRIKRVTVSALDAGCGAVPSGGTMPPASG